MALCSTARWARAILCTTRPPSSRSQPRARRRRWRAHGGGRPKARHARWAGARARCVLGDQVLRGPAEAHADEVHVRAARVGPRGDALVPLPELATLPELAKGEGCATRDGHMRTSGTSKTPPIVVQGRAPAPKSGPPLLAWTLSSGRYLV